MNESNDVNNNDNDNDNEGSNYSFANREQDGSMLLGDASIGEQPTNSRNLFLFSRRSIVWCLMTMGAVCFFAIASYSVYITQEDHLAGMVTLDADAPPEIWESQKHRMGKAKDDEQLRKTGSSKAKPKSNKSKMNRHKFQNKRKSKKDEPAFQIIEQNDDFVPTGRSSFLQHASDILECRDSVINFVINATDARDECQGLKKAFDKTCNIDSSEAIRNNRHKHHHGGPNRGRRKLVFESGASRLHNLKYRFYRTMRWISDLWYYSVCHQPVNFFAEEQVVNLWDRARYQVQQNYDLIIRREYLGMMTFQRRRLEEQRQQTEESPESTYLTDGHISPSDVIHESQNSESNSLLHATESNNIAQTNQNIGIRETDGRDNPAKANYKGEEPKYSYRQSATRGGSEGNDRTNPLTKNSVDVANTGAESEANGAEEDGPPKGKGLSSRTSNRPDEKHPHKLQSLTLPTSSERISGQMLSETLMLQRSENTIKTAIKAAARNQTNTTLSDAAVDAVASAQMVRETANVISAVLNDPSSVEARTCCASIIDVFHQNCDTPDKDVVSDQNLFLIVFVFALCGIVKSVIRHFEINWIPEAAGCILVGVACGAVMTSYVPHFDVSFDGDVFLRVMVPPIVLEAALSIDKKSFHRHFVPVLIYAFCGTLMATIITAFIIHRGTVVLRGLCETIPFVESLAYGALISSIDPIAVLSVLSSMGMSHTDSIYVIIFGEALLNDGIAIVLFETLVHFLDEALVIDMDAVVSGTIHFFVVAFGSLFVGVASGIVGTFYFWVMQGCQTAIVEVLMFFCWAFTPYYICDGAGWSGIVAVVATGFAMDLFVVGEHQASNKMEVESSHANDDVSSNRRSRRRSLFYRKGHLSKEARAHVGFVCELLSTMMETAIFAYLGVFLFSSRYHWNRWHIILSIFACCASRAIMIPSLTIWTNWLTRVQTDAERTERSRRLRSKPSKIRHTEVTINSKMQIVLWFAGLRGAMSFALVENIPLYDAVTGEGSRLKAELKAMTSATIIFTVFFLGGMTSCVMERLGMVPAQNLDRVTAGSSTHEITRDAPPSPEKDSSVRLRQRHGD